MLSALRRRAALALIGALALPAAFAPAGTASVDSEHRDAAQAARPARTGTIALQSSTVPHGALKDETLSSHLVLLADAAERAGARISAAAAPPELRHLLAAGRMRLAGDGAVQVYVHTDEAGATAALEALGATVERRDEDAGIVQAWVPPAALRAIAAVEGVRAVRLPDYAVANTGSVTTEGDTLMRSNDVRTTYDVDGTGVSVGLISDGLTGLFASQASGDLPSIDITPCNITGGPAILTGAEGTAMLEIVHDVAPGAELAFGTISTLEGLGTSLDFNEAVDCLAGLYDIVLDDISFYAAGPYDGSSIVSANSAEALNGDGTVRAHFTAAGNDARRHYQDEFIDSGTIITDGVSVWNAHLFEVTPGPAGTKHAGLLGDPASGNRFLLRPGGTATISLVWDDPWGASANDYDLFFRTGPDAFFCGFDRQDGSGGNDFPTEGCSVTNPSSQVIEIDVLIGNFQESAEQVSLDLFVLCGDCLILNNGNHLDFTTGASSIPNQADAGGSPASVISVGAVRHSIPNAIEAFSSRGPTEDGRLKPDVSAPDGVSVTGSGGFGSPFFGTSAAAAHASAVAALLLECQPGLSRQELREYVVTTALDLGLFGPDNTFGFGRLSAPAAGNAANCANATVTPTGQPTETPTPGGATPTATPSPSPTPPCLAGDANGSGAVNSIDAAVVLQFTAGLIQSVPCAQGADADTNGVVGSIDAALILQLVAGLIPGLPV